MAFLRKVSALSLAPMLACTFNAGGLGQSGETGDASQTGGASTSGVASSGGPSSEPPTTDVPTSVGPTSDASATGSTGPVDPDTSVSGSDTTVDPSGTTGGLMSTSSGDGSTSGDASSGGGDTGCMEKMFYKDMDDDGYGDAKMMKLACVAPQGYVDNPDDCDDKSGAKHPGAPEVCGGGDNDCDKVIDEFDPQSNTDCGGCKMYLYIANNRVYHFCSNVEKWAGAKGKCENRGGLLAKDIDSAHHDWLVAQLPSGSGPWWIGASSPNNNMFTWIDGTVVPVPDGRWSPGHPWPGGNDHIVLVSNGNLDIWANDNGRWFDREDFDNQPYICETAYLP